MFAEGSSASSYLKCDACGGMLIETARKDHPRLPAHEDSNGCLSCMRRAHEEMGLAKPVLKRLALRFKFPGWRNR